MLEAEQSGDAVERKGTALHEPVHTRLRDPKEAGNFVRCEELSRRSGGWRLVDGHKE